MNTTTNKDFAVVRTFTGISLATVTVKAVIFLTIEYSVGHVSTTYLF